MHCCSFKGKKKEFIIHSKELTDVNENAMAITQVKPTHWLGQQT